MSFCYPIITHTQKGNPKQSTVLYKDWKWNLLVIIHIRNHKMFCSFIEKYLFSFLFCLFLFFRYTYVLSLFMSSSCMYSIWEGSESQLFFSQYISLLISCVLNAVNVLTTYKNWMIYLYIIIYINIKRLIYIKEKQELMSQSVLGYSTT